MTRAGGSGVTRIGILALLLVVVLALDPSRGAAAVNVCPSAETASVHNGGDAADDDAIWIHPSNPALSTVIGTDKSVAGGLNVYDLAGSELQFKADGRLNNDDVRYNFPLGSARVALVGATNRLTLSLDFYRVDEATRLLVKVGSVRLAAGTKIVTPRGFAFYHSRVSGKYYAFVTDIGHTEQYELDGSSGQVTGTRVRVLQDTPVLHTEGLVADDELGRVYLAEEDIGGIWRFGAEPGDPVGGVKVATTTEVGGPIVQDVKGLLMYFASGGRGYLIAVSQGGNSFHVFNRGDNAWVGEFRVVACGGIDAVTGIDGADVTNFGLGPSFPQGLFVAQDTANDTGNQNHKLVPWQNVATAFNPPLIIDTTWDPRCIGAPVPCGSNATTPPGGTTPGAGGGAGGPGAAGVAASADRTNIFRVRVDGTRLRRLTTSPAGVSYDAPAWSRNGRLIAFSGPVCSGCATGLFVVPAAGGAPRRVPGAAPGATRPSWSPLDRSLAYVAGSTNVWSITPTGGVARRLAGGDAPHDQAVWSPDGRQVVFTSQQWNGAWDLWVMGANGSRKRNLTRSALSEREPAWSHDGRRIAFSRRVGGRWAVFVMAATGGRARRVTPASVDCRQPAWSANDRQLACSSTTPAGSSILVMRTDGTRRRRVPTATVTASSPSWSPDGQTIAFAGRG